MSGPKVPINPGVSVLGVLKHLNYKEWFAIAEFVDNSVQSFRSNREALGAVGSDTLTVRVLIEDEGIIRIEDNAAGIPLSEFPRAFRPAQAPSDASGLSEFGMGMKSAACWFAPRWSVRTKALGEDVERIVELDVATIVDLSLDELHAEENAARRDAHYTVVELFDVTRLPRMKTLTKIREHLADIYRQFLREGWLRLEVKGEALSYDDPDVLLQPPEWDKAAEPISWRKEIDFDFGEGKSAKGFAALFATASTRRAGFALFRRGRLIQGSADEGFKPHTIFGSANSFRRQRLFGELNLEGFQVSHTKDGFQWEEEEQEAFLELLKERLAQDPIPLLKQADEFRARKAKEELEDVARKAAKETARDAEKGFTAASTGRAQDDAAEEPEAEAAVRTLADEVFVARIDGQAWEVHVQPTMDDAERDWLRVLNTELQDGTRKVVIRVSAHHPFNVRFVDDDERAWQAMLRTAAAVAIGQVLARTGSKDAAIGASATVRGINKALKGMSE
ncbi:ATP-binding protein [Pseudoroseicyclus tamaricis]|uniref:ATP-binding protein n=1 Tax=Pseudoroseicyclus tamaricis TaxID=2705421 RepID=A0A6B2JYQ5_9RHOB|nr:ATP-binding protein [Pseudoroseicyclus tamaricis]NDV02895.1 ATP-binding protein [Pseudoroseicyclus tamaricis]